MTHDCGVTNWLLSPTGYGNIRLSPQRRELSLSVVCAACCHMALVFAVMHLYNSFDRVEKMPN